MNETGRSRMYRSSASLTESLVVLADVVSIASDTTVVTQ